MSSSVDSHDYPSLNRFVRKYFEDQIEQGRTVDQIIGNFRAMPLPGELKTSGFPPMQLRRHGQIVATEYKINQLNSRRATI